MQRSLLLPHIPTLPSDSGVALFRKGFRPFFLLAALHALAFVPLWLAVLHGSFAPHPYWTPAVWHAHEMLSGFATAVIAGFLLTAVGNWTQRETATGGALMALVVLWLAGRAAIFFADSLPRATPALVDLAFLPALMVTLARPLLASQNKRNFVMLAVLGALFATNLVTHLEALAVLGGGVGRRGNLVAVDIIVLLISIIAGRVLPLFTRNATHVETIRSIAWLDRASIAALLVTCLHDALRGPDTRLAGLLAGAAGLLTGARALHWGARHTRRDPLLWILHVGYGWLVLGLLLRGASLLLGPPLASMATHALTVGAIGTLTLGMMARVALGHTGHMLAAPAPMTAAFVAITLAALIRTGAPLFPAHYLTALVAAGVFWTLAFLIFLLTYSPLLLRPRIDGRPG
ncbi:MAG TPA: NnrS family protein [Polyangiaceae bacterium]|nr:NnrS family protein [Polyangiaceae bacterium]